MPGHCQKADKFLPRQQSKDTPLHKTSCFAAHTQTHARTHTRHPAELIPTLIICLMLVDHRVPKV